MFKGSFEILMLKDTSKESDLYADFKYHEKRNRTDVFRGIFFGLGVAFRGGGYMGGFFLGGIFHGEEKFNEKGPGFSSITIKNNNENINMNKFFQLKVRRSIKTQNEQRLLRI